MTKQGSHTVCPECSTCFTPDAHDILIKRLVEDNNRLRQALEILTKDPCGFCCDCPDIREHARAALEGKE